MEARNLPDRESYRQLGTEGLRRNFLLDKLFSPGTIAAAYCDADRVIVGGAVPTTSAIPLVASHSEMAAGFFAERREIGIVNVGAEGVIVADGKRYTLQSKDMLYVGRGTRSIEFSNANPSHHAVFYFVSYPAHAEYPVAMASYRDAEKTALGSGDSANRRTINKYIHPGGVKSCQLVMGLTELAPGSVWNTMPPHTHVRRSEVYLYFGLDPDSIVVHLMGIPGETRSLIVRNQEAVVSPNWSIHCAAATKSYSFVWAMGGENQEFSDMDPAPVRDLR